MREPKVIMELQVKLVEDTDECPVGPLIVKATEVHYFVLDYRCFDSLDEIRDRICERLFANRTDAVAAKLEKIALSLCAAIQSNAHESMAASDNNDDDPIHLSWEVDVTQDNNAGGDEKEFHSDDPRTAPAPTLPAASGKRNAADDDEFEKMCVVCQEQLRRAKSVTVLPCSHEYHERCITAWLQRDKTCPLCRFRLPACGWQGSIYSS